ncbi:ankyrin repeat and MYND domain-containing protein 1-like [Montipora foliosa]|uniref:ankyrin repeat and MYND domain-containing protein 1-like n=1 Tax=Montipora foliosa TaxID=591990 RepID=UPI0035F19215
MKSGTKISSSNRVLRLNTSQCRREYKSGAVYHGEVEGIKKSGRGIFRWPNGACYDGQYVDNTRHGYGKQCWPDGSIYDGALLRDMRHGVGTLCWSDGESYAGEFYQDRKHGKGIYTWPDGTKFEGHFENDKKEGFGTFTFPSGNKFEGLYRRGVRDGPGIMTYSNDEHDIGHWNGERLIKLCSVMDSAFLFQHYSNYNVNAGNNLSAKVRRANTAKEGTRNSMPSLQDFEENGNNKLLSQIPNWFPYSDILEGIRGDKGPKGPVEKASEEFLRAAAAGDCIKVRSLIESGSVHVDVADKTGYTALLAASVNCHRDVINCLLDNGANVNKLNDEGLSALAACHVLFYTKHTWKDNIAENIPVENLFNCIQEDLQKGIYIHRNYRQSHLVDGVVSEANTESEGANENSEDKCRENLIDCENDQMETNAQTMYRIIELTSRTVGDKDTNSNGIENSNLNQSRSDSRKNGFVTRNTTSNQETESVVDGDNANNSNIDLLMPFSGVLSPDKFGDKTSGKPKVMAPSLFSIMSVVSSTRQPSESTDDVLSENSMEQNKQVLLAVQRRPHLEATVRLLLKRGADPNASALPMPVLFFAVKAADAAAVEILLQKGADTSAKLSKEKLGIAPLHIAVALPDGTGVEITELLLNSGADPNIRDCAFGSENNGRTPAHIACLREDNDKVSSAVVGLLLQNGANPDILCEGHSALSLAILSGNDMAVNTLLEHGVNPSLGLSKGVGSALCAATSFMAERRRTPADRIKLINKLMRAGANILSPITVNLKYPPGTVVDYAYNVFYQDRKIAHTPYHALSATERDCYNARREMLDHLGDLLRTQVLKKEKELIDKQIKEAEKQTDEEKLEVTSLSAFGDLKSPEKPSLLRPDKEPIPDGKNDKLRFSRVSFRLENEVVGGDEIEAIVGHEVSAVHRLNDNYHGSDNEEEKRDITTEIPSTAETSKTSTPSFGRSAFEQSTSKPSSPGRDEHCGLRIAVTKAADHMSISALATQSLKQRQQVMKNRFRYCYECGRSIAIRLSACTRCKEVFYCSKSCKLKAWNARHREECVRLTGGIKTSSSRRAESPTPTTDPDGSPPLSTTPTGSHRKTPSRARVEKTRKVQVGSSRASKRSNASSGTKVKK